MAMSSIQQHPADMLTGMTLADGWYVENLITPGPKATGGHFSSSYRVTRNGHVAFLKALDYVAALGAEDPPAALAQLTAAFLFERDILQRCGTSRLRNVVRIVADGNITVLQGGPISGVSYLIFEMADGDVRHFRSLSSCIDVAWALRTLHNASCGIQQLHLRGIVHQDMKPSNLLLFEKGQIAKLGDLGCASVQGEVGPRDHCRVAGDGSYAPPEALYGFTSADWGTRRRACDLFHLGSLLLFLLTDTTITGALMAELDKAYWPAVYGGGWLGVYDDVVEDWRHHRHAVFAANLVSSALTHGDLPEAREAADFLLSSPDASVLSRAVARRYTASVTAARQTLITPDDGLDPERIRRRIGRLRRQSNRDPRNVLLWVERARQYVLRGQSESAEKVMRVALAGAPNDRFVLRAAARLWVHAGNAAEAHKALLRSERTHADPWLISAEIAVASIAGREPRFVNAGRDMLACGLDPRHATELASALATLEMENGNDRRAKRLFSASLQEPNENALAQAEWASARVPIANLSAQFDRVPDSWEARARNAASRDVAIAVREAFLWLADQPYSSDAAVFGSYQASKIEAYDDGVRFAEQGLIANPHETVLLNNYAFCLAKSERVSEARDTLRHIPVATFDGGDIGCTLTATRGLVEFRSGHRERGLALYAKAIAMTTDRVRRATASVMMAIELVRERPEDSEEIIRVATDELGLIPTQEAHYWRLQLHTAHGRPSAGHAESGEVERGAFTG